MSDKTYNISVWRAAKAVDGPWSDMFPWKWEAWYDGVFIDEGATFTKWGGKKAAKKAVALHKERASALYSKMSRWSKEIV
jgi:hypothetical protein